MTTTEISSEKRDSVVQKIKSLLALAGNNPEENEVEAATEKAAALMAKYSISNAEVFAAISDSDRDSLVEWEEVYCNTSRKWVTNLAANVAHAVGVSAIIHRSGRYGAKEERRITFVGPTEDLKFVVEIFNYILVQIPNLTDRAFTLAKALNPETTPHGKTFKFSYALGLGDGIGRIIRSQYGAVEVSDQASKGLILAKDAVDRKVGELFPRLSRRKSAAVNIHGDSYVKGLNDADKVSYISRNALED